MKGRDATVPPLCLIKRKKELDEPLMSNIAVADTAKMQHPAHENLKWPRGWKQNVPFSCIFEAAWSREWAWTHAAAWMSLSNFLWTVLHISLTSWRFLFRTLKQAFRKKILFLLKRNEILCTDEVLLSKVKQTILSNKWCWTLCDVSLRGTCSLE